jgi:hypothetical protein
MATAVPSPTPNPDALRFQLDVTLPEMVSFKSAEEAADHPFAAAVFAAGGVANVFGTADFVTVTREPGTDWDELTPVVVAAAAEHL